MKKIKLFALGSAAALVLAGCGGGGGGGGDEPSLPLADLQGYWNGEITGPALGDATKARAVVLEDGTAWIFLHDGSQQSEPLLGLATAKISPVQQRFTGAGKLYPFSDAAVRDISVSGGAPVGTAFQIAVASNGDNASLALTYNAAYDTAAVQADVVGDWGITAEGDTITTTWTVASNGALTGDSTLGCTYTGSVVPRNATTAVYAVAVTETCGSDTPKQLSGIGRLNTTKDFLTFGLTTADKADALAFAAEKQ